jgi:hypothetical protein
MAMNPYDQYQFVAVCAGCGLDIESWDDALILKENGKRIYVHKELDCLREAAGAMTVTDEAEIDREI